MCGQTLLTQFMSSYDLPVQKVFLKSRVWSPQLFVRYSHRREVCEERESS